MKLLGLSDIHGNHMAIHKLIRNEVGRQADIIVIAGDTSRETFGVFLRRILNKIGIRSLEDIDTFKANNQHLRNSQLENAKNVIRAALIAEKPLLVLIGNEDPQVVADYLKATEKEDKNLVLLHNKKTTIAGYTFIGFGGTSLKFSMKHETLNAYPHVFSEKDIYQGLSGLLEYEEPRKTIIVTHDFPYGVRITNIPELMGSRSLRQIIEEFQPLLCICGHLHEQRIDWIGKTMVVNPGSLAYFNYALLEVNGEVKVKLQTIPHFFINVNYQFLLPRLYHRILKIPN